MRRTTHTVNDRVRVVCECEWWEQCKRKNQRQEHLSHIAPKWRTMPIDMDRPTDRTGLIDDDEKRFSTKWKKKQNLNQAIECLVVYLCKFLFILFLVSMVVGAVSRTHNSMLCASLDAFRLSFTIDCVENEMENREHGNRDTQFELVTRFFLYCCSSIGRWRCCCCWLSSSSRRGVWSCSRCRLMAMRLDRRQQQYQRHVLFSFSSILFTPRNSNRFLQNSRFIAPVRYLWYTWRWFWSTDFPNTHVLSATLRRISILSNAPTHSAIRSFV